MKKKKTKKKKKKKKKKKRRFMTDVVQKPLYTKGNRLIEIY